MGALRDAISAVATIEQRAAFAAEDWCKANPGWLRICDIPEDVYRKSVRVQWGEIPQTERDEWVDRHDNEADAQLAWEVFGWDGRYQVPAAFIDDKGEFLTLDAWRSGSHAERGFMMIFQVETPSKKGWRNVALISDVD